jgi:hypothetical protein
MTYSRIAVVTALIASFAIPTAAHHSLAATYRLDEMETIRGTVLKVAFRDPHVYLHVEARSAAGVPHRWSLEWRDIQTLQRTGVTRDTLRPGDQIDVVGHPDKDADTRRLLIASMSRPTDRWSWGDDDLE